MAGIDNTTYFRILKHLSGKIDENKKIDDKYNKEILLDLYIFDPPADKDTSSTLPSKIMYGQTKKPKTVYWPRSDAPAWYDVRNYSKESKEAFKDLDARANEQRFPDDSFPGRYTFSSLAYDVLLGYMKDYEKKMGKKGLEAVKDKICVALDDFCLPESFSHDILNKNSMKEIAEIIILSAATAIHRADKVSQFAKATLLGLKRLSYGELPSKGKEKIEQSLATMAPHVCPNAKSEADISASWTEALKKHSSYFNFLVREETGKLVGCSFWLPTDKQYKGNILNGTLFEKSLSSSFTPFIPRTGDYLFTILSLNILSKEDDETITLKTRSNLKILMDSLWNTLIDYAKKGIFFKTLYANVPVDTAFWEDLGFVKHPKANGVFFLDMTTISDGVCPKELQQLYAEHFKKNGFMKVVSLLKKYFKNMRKKGLISIASAVLVFLLILGVAKILFPPPPPPVDEPEEPESTADVETAPEENYTIMLAPSSTMSIMDFNSNVETIKKRLDVLCDGEEYTLETDNLTLTLVLPKSVFHGEDPESIMVAYVGQAGNLYLLDKQNYGIYGGDSLSIERKDIESVSYKTGTIEDLDIAKFNIEAEPYTYIELILTPECADKIVAEISDWNEPVFAHDITCDQWFYFNTFLDLENRAIYLPGDESDSHFADLMVHLYTEDPLTDSLFVEVNRETEWECVAEATYPGANQCDIEGLQGPTVQVVYTSFRAEKNSGDWVDSEVGFKERLDLLEQPYAYGTFVSSDGYISTVIRTSPTRMGPPIMSLLSCHKSDFVYVCGNKHAVFEAYNTETEIITKDAESREYSMETLVSDWYETTNLRNLLPVLDDGESCELKLCLDFVPVLSAYVDNSLEEKQVNFTHLSFNDHEALSSSNEWVLKLMDAIINDSRIIAFTPSSYEFYDEQGEIIDEGTFGIHYAEYIDKLNDSMDSINKDMLYSYSSTDPGVLYVYTYLPVDESLPQASVEMAENIFLASDFENSFLSTISIILIDEDNVEKERARIFFYKTSYQETISYDTIFTNGRLNKYSAEFESAINSSSLFAGLDSW